MFNWSDLARIARKVFLRTPIGQVELERFYYVLLFLNAATYGIFRRLAFPAGSRRLGEAYFILQSAMTDLARAAAMFPEHGRQQILGMVRESLMLGGEVRTPAVPN